MDLSQCEHFRKQAPPSFEGKADPMVVKFWLKSVESFFDHMELNDHQRTDFVQSFGKKYFIATVLATRVDEFVTLVQGSLSITDYAMKFDRLARFVSEIEPTDAMGVQSFMKGLKPMIARDAKMTSAEVVSYAEVLKALEVEYLEDSIWKDSVARREANGNKGFHEVNKRKAYEGQSSGNDKKPRPLTTNGNNHNNHNNHNNYNSHNNDRNRGNHQDNKVEHPIYPKSSR
ncbi:uncharacterized protein LOC133815156 [Humulus lupulus]|uniref:uncharacterized protein LOC133815156 n=1 Tax=Humulus lupulus TaxID=3486 RepID=UPI002B40107C|nr:uncharacterized protein LOC133815156 [Humulus lupulus]